MLQREAEIISSRLPALPGQRALALSSPAACGPTRDTLGKRRDGYCWVTCPCWPPSWGGHRACGPQAVVPAPLWVRAGAEQQVLLIQTTVLTCPLQCCGMCSLLGCSRKPHVSGLRLFLGFSEPIKKTHRRKFGLCFPPGRCSEEICRIDQGGLFLVVTLLGVTRGPGASEPPAGLGSANLERPTCPAPARCPNPPGATEARSTGAPQPDRKSVG